MGGRITFAFSVTSLGQLLLVKSTGYMYNMSLPFLSSLASLVSCSTLSHLVLSVDMIIRIGLATQSHNNFANTE